MKYAKLVSVVSVVVAMAEAGSYVRILDDNYQQGPKQERTQQFTFYQGDTIVIATEVVRGKDISDLVFADADGNSVFSRHAYGGGSETLCIQTTGFYSLTIRNTAMFQQKTYNVRLERSNPDPRIQAKPTAYRTRTVCDTTWTHFTRVDTLSIERVDTSANALIDKTVHLGATMRSGQTSDVTTVTIPAVTYARGYTPDVVFYAANVESDRALLDVGGSAVMKVATTMVDPTGLAGLLLGGVSLTSVAKGNDFGWELKYTGTNLLGQTEQATRTPYCRVRSTREVVGYDIAHPRNWSIQLDNSFSTMTTKDVVLKVLLVRYSPVFRTAEHPDSTMQVETRKVPILPED